ncbi:SCO family protein [Pedobacter cryoconitis]|uniref:SCO family protein n=1 Tax=Pedobacter cryoconitis TaxID=188932 RepID=UPI001621CE4C|nr:SCO family protein [Pedobacter cryoconitis]MBB5645724.1 protein SCO1/2 [Pedobacter cryoconitis]
MKIVLVLVFIVLIFGCSRNEIRLPILGNPEVIGKDTIYPTIKPFSFTDQRNELVTNDTFKGKVYIADFIFLSCPTICPKMTIQMKKVYDAYYLDEDVLFLSHTIDPEHDTVEKLRAHSDALGVDPLKWHFVTGEKEAIYSIAADSYFATAHADSKAPGGYVHSGGLLLIDKNQHIRGVYDGTSAEETTRLISDLEILIKEEFPGRAIK